MTAHANALIDKAVELQNEGRWYEADRVLDQARAALDAIDPTDDYHAHESTLNALDEVCEESDPNADLVGYRLGESLVVTGTWPVNANYVLAGDTVRVASQVRRAKMIEGGLS